MNNKPLRILRKLALTFGWIGSVLFFLYGLASVLSPSKLLVEYAMSYNNMGELITTIFTLFGHTFLAFLIASVVRMIEKQVPIGKDVASRLMYACCLSYIAAALGETYQIILYFRTFNYPMGFSIFPIIIQLLIPLLYATSIFVFYNHFTKMVTFESEVA